MLLLRVVSMVCICMTTSTKSVSVNNYICASSLDVLLCDWHYKIICGLTKTVLKDTTDFLQFSLRYFN